jgi:hypothetical protein
VNAPLLLEPERCALCGERMGLVCSTVKGRICPRCYMKSGQPEGAPLRTITAHEQVAETQKRMLKRKGEDAHRVRAGKS